MPLIPAQQAFQQGLVQAPQDTGTPGIDAGGALGLARGGLNAAGSLGNFLNVPGAGYLGYASGPLSIGQGIATGNPLQIGQGALSTGLTVGQELGYLPSLSGLVSSALLAGPTASGGIGAATGLLGGTGAASAGL